MAGLEVRDLKTLDEIAGLPDHKVRSMISKDPRLSGGMSKPPRWAQISTVPQRLSRPLLQIRCLASVSLATGNTPLTCPKIRKSENQNSKHLKQI